VRARVGLSEDEFVALFCSSWNIFYLLFFCCCAGILSYNNNHLLVTTISILYGPNVSVHIASPYAPVHARPRAPLCPHAALAMPTPRFTPTALAPIFFVPPPSHPCCDTAPSSLDHRQANPTVVLLLGCPFHPLGRPLQSFPFLSLTLCSSRSPPAPVSVDLTNPSPPVIASLPHKEPDR
jgi:hypothetical protein